ncbi:MAG TPA: hypothetical protein VFN31_01530 [Candidatus Saccharimonadales bacterium]|nr:hypothetical protein [Candidatus Saccharimonadales bacterium]
MPRQINHLKHHQPMPSATLMRRSVNRPKQLPHKLKTNGALQHHAKVTLDPSPERHVKPERLARAQLAPKSQFISHFMTPSHSHFVASQHQPLSAIVHKPKIETTQTIDQLMLKAIDTVEDQIINLEQQPVRRFSRYTRALVANRFNGIALN